MKKFFRVKFTLLCWSQFFSPAELYWKQRIALAVLTDSTKVNSEVYLIEIPIVIENTVFTIADEGFESGTGELDQHTSDNTISENQSVVDHSVDIPDVIIVGVYISMNNESETSVFDHHTSDSIISENASVVSMSVEIPDVIIVEVDIPMNDTCDELSKCFDVIEVQTKVFTVECDFCTFTSSRVKKFHQHLREVHRNTYGSRWTYSDTCSERILPKYISC